MVGAYDSFSSSTISPKLSSVVSLVIQCYCAATQFAAGLALLSVLFPVSNFASAQLLTESISKDNSPACDCFLTSGPDPSFFQYHRFWDFRSIASTPDDDYTSVPPLITASDNQGLEFVTSSYFNTTRWNADWSIQNWSSDATAASPIQAVNSAQNLFISRNTTDSLNSTYLTLRASRLPDFMSIVEIDSLQNNLFYSSIRVRLRVIPNGLSDASAPRAANTTDFNDTGSSPDHPVDNGAVLGFFTYYNDTSESDTEILTADPTDRIRYSNQPDYIASTDTTVPGASNDAFTPDGLVWTEWLDHRMDWHEGISRWYIGDVLLVNKTINVPRNPAGMVLNLWGDGGEWSGNMSVGGQVMVGVEWIEMVFNISGPLVGEGGASETKKRWSLPGIGMLVREENSACHVGCRVDGVQRVGFPEVMFNSTSGAGRLRELSMGESTGRSTVWSVVMMASIGLWIV